MAEAPAIELIAEEYVEPARGFLTRIEVVDGACALAVKRSVADNGLSAYRFGSTYAAYPDVPRTVTDAAERGATVLSIELGSFDVIEGARGPCLIDANSVSNVSEDCTELLGMDLMRAHAEAGDTVEVISATFEPIILRAMERHPFDNQISTRMSVATDGTYTRAVEGLPVEGEEKLAAVRRFGDSRFGPGNWELAYAYGDHHSDRAVLSAAEHPRAVSPDRPLARTAREKGWEILDW